MKKIIRLTESDLVRIVKRVVSEQTEQNDLSTKVEKVINHPKVEMKLEDIYSNLDDDAKMELQNVLDNLGIDENSSADEVHSKIESTIEDNDGGEMLENENPRHKVVKILHGIGAANIAAFGGIPAAIAIGAALSGTVGSPMAAGFAISWGATGLLMGLARLLAGDDKIQGVNNDYSDREF